MLRLPVSSAALALIVVASTCRSLVGAGPPTPLPTPTATIAPTAEPTFTPEPPAFEIILWERDGSQMVMVPGGDAIIGLDEPPDPETNGAESPAHMVFVEAFLIDRHEVSNARFARFVDDGGYRTRQYWTNEGWRWVQSNQISAPLYWGQPDFGLPQQPVVTVSWYEAYAYCLWAAKRLPDEAEWEKAARGTDGRLYPWGNGWDCTLGNFDDEVIVSPGANECAGRDGHNLTAPVGSYENGQSLYHVHDMVGNVWEWTLSRFAEYPFAAHDGRNLPDSEGMRVIRGSSWFTFTGQPGIDHRARLTFRAELSPETRDESVGFRCLADVR